MALDFVAGCLGGCAGVLVGHPFDTVKVRLQTQDAKNPLYRGTFHCIISTIRKESMSGLYKGMSSPMAGLAAINAIVFGVYGNLQRLSSSPDSFGSHFVAGSTAGLVQSLITSPMELAKTRMQLQGMGRPRVELPYWKKPVCYYTNPLDCLQKVFQTEGFRGIFRGMSCTMLRDLPAFGIYFSGYEFLTQQVFSDSRGEVSTTGLMVAGGLAGVISWIMIYPFDVIKSRLQIDGMSGPRKYRGLWDCAVKSYHVDGLGVFTRGLNSTLIRAFPTNAATFTVFTWVFTLFDGERDGLELRMERTPGMIMEKEFNRVAACVDTCI